MMNAQEHLKDSQTGLRIAVFGEWGKSNLGDWAIYEGVQKYFSNLVRKVDCYQCGALRPFEGSNGIVKDVADKHSRPLLQMSKLSFPLLGSWPGLKRSVRGLRQEFLIRRLMPRLAEADLICVGGGALLTDSNLHFPQSLIVIAAAAMELRKPLWCLGCSVEGEWSGKGRQMIQEFLDCCDVIAVRDKVTAARITDLIGRRVPVFGDFALSTSSINSPLPVGTAKYLLGVNISYLAPPWSVYQREYEETLAEVVRQFLNCGVDDSRILIFTTGTPQDDEPAQRFQNRLSKSVEVCKPHDVNELRRVLRDSEIVLATRLHSAILGLAEGRPVIGVSPTPKISNFFETIGLDRFSLRIPEAKASDVMQLMGDTRALDHQLETLNYNECRGTRRTVASAIWHLGRRPLMAS